MSGGSWDYLYCKDGTEIENRAEDIKRMGERLIKEGYPEIGKRFFNFYEDLQIMISKKESFMEKYGQIMRAVEWWDSGDSGPDYLEREIELVSK